MGIVKLTFLGATHEVTGSCTLLTAGSMKVLIDCGMEQGKDIFVNQELPVNPADIDMVLLTHAHIDHSGNLPLLAKRGFSGTIYATEATAALCNIMLQDSAHIQEFEAEWRNRKAERSGRPRYEPIYTMDDALAAVKLFRPCPYDRKVQVAENIVIRFTDIGHLLGSSSIEVWVTENGETRKLVFSGDIGNYDQPIIRDPSRIDDADYVLIESTYGNRYHGERPDYIKELSRMIQETLDRGGNVVVPCFAEGRTQEMLFFIRQIKAEGLVKGHDGFKVYVDSPLANEATGIFMQTDRSYFDEETRALIDKGINPINFPGLCVSVSSDESKMINDDPEPKVILSASGMCEAGRIRHHLKHNLWRADSLVLFVGYQAEGTLGRTIFDGAKQVKLFGEEIQVNAQIEFLDGISGHADKEGLLDWITAFKEKPRMVFVNHGEDAVCTDFMECLSEEYGFRASAPFSGSIYDLLADDWELQTEGIPVPEKENAPKTPSQAKVNATYRSLNEAVERLQQLVANGSGRPNKDMIKLTRAISELCDKWE